MPALAAAPLPLPVPLPLPAPLNVAGENAYVPGVFQYPLNALLLKGLFQAAFGAPLLFTPPVLAVRVVPLLLFFAFPLLTVRPFAVRLFAFRLSKFPAFVPAPPVFVPFEPDTFARPVVQPAVPPLALLVVRAVVRPELTLLVLPV